MAELHLLSPAGFQASGVASGIKSRGKPDVGLLVADHLCAAAAVFTTNKVVAAPIKIGREHIRRGKLRGIVVNSGNANACTGRQGEKDAMRMCRLAGKAVGCEAWHVLPSSTGIIGRWMPMEKVERGIIEAAHALGNSHEQSQLFADTILTTDLRRKSAAVEFRIGRRRVRLAGVCKGSGMIGPRMALPNNRPSGKSAALHATMLAYLTTDADISVPLLRRLLQHSTDESFNAVTVDDHASTNDTAAILASGLSGVKIVGANAQATFAAALKEVCRSLAYQIAADGEGATKVVSITVKNAISDAAAGAMARAIANSPLVKCAMHGNDPNWGRIVSAAGMAGVPFDPDRCVLKLQNTPVFRAGRPIPFDGALLSAAMDAPEVKILLDCRGGKGLGTCWTCDLSKQYVTINAEYHT